MSSDKIAERSLSGMVEKDTTNDLNNMPGFVEIEEVVVLREAAGEEIEKLRRSGRPDAERRIREIELALAAMEGAHHTADHHDAGEQCSERPHIRQGKVA